MLSSLSLKNSVWAGPILGFANGLLNFLKNEIKAWVRNIVEFFGGRRLAPMWEIRRGFFTQLLTQEYEGREVSDTTCVYCLGALPLTLTLTLTLMLQLLNFNYCPLFSRRAILQSTRGGDIDPSQVLWLIAFIIRVIAILRNGCALRRWRHGGTFPKSSPIAL